ncbi:DUF1846 family protein [Candidatus Thorarchaeota archaeon]|nr:MAG: DUF1846 family protein [Candidatus Thorarchaeota archaeon]
MKSCHREAYGVCQSESAALLNAVKYLTGIPDDIDVLSPIIIESIVRLKEHIEPESRALFHQSTFHAIVWLQSYSESPSESSGIRPFLFRGATIRFFAFSFSSLILSTPRSLRASSILIMVFWKIKPSAAEISFQMNL